MIRVERWTRRAFLRDGALISGALVLGACREEAAAPAAPASDPRPPTPFDALLTIDTEGVATVTIAKTEMGQGISTALPMIVAEELDLPFERVRVETAIADGWPPSMGTAASSSVRFSYEPLRTAGAAAREMLVAAAAGRWAVPVSACRADAGWVHHDASGRRLGYGALALDAAGQPVPEAPALRDPAAFRVIGTRPPRLDLREKLEGRSTYGVDVRLPDQRVAALLPPGTPTRELSDAALREEVGVLGTIATPEGIAVLAEDAAAARRGVARLATGSARGEIALDPWFAELDARLETSGIEAFRAGDEAPPPSDAIHVRADYGVPFLAQATLEPGSCTARWDERGHCELHFATQAQARARIAVERALEVPATSVRVVTPALGGGFGGKVEPTLAVAAARLSRELGHPVQVLRFREQDFDAAALRPAFRARLEAWIAPDGTPLRWQHRCAGPSYDAQDAPAWVQRAVERLQRIAGGLPVPEWVPWSIRRRAQWMGDPRDLVALDGAEVPHYPIASRRIEFHRVPTPLRVGWWRSVGHHHNAFFVESFVDEIAAAVGIAPLALRRRWLSARPRAKAVLDAVARRARLGEDAPRGRARGVAIWECFGGVYAAVAECSDANGVPRVERVWIAADAGRVVHPGIAEQQLEGGFLFGLSPTLREAYRPGDANLDAYPILTLAETPQIELDWVASEEAPAGIGEAATPLAAPAVANAWAALTGERRRQLPFVERAGSASGSGSSRTG